MQLIKLGFSVQHLSVTDGYTNALRPARLKAKGLCWLQPEDQGSIPAEGPGQVLARGLSEVCLLRLPAGGGGLHALHQSQSHPLPTGLPTIIRGDGELRGLQQAHPGLRDGHEGQGKRLPPGLLRLSALQSEILRGGQILPEEQHDSVPDGLRGGPDERRIRAPSPLIPPLVPYGPQHTDPYPSREREKETCDQTPNVPIPFHHPRHV